MSDPKIDTRIDVPTRRNALLLWMVCTPVFPVLVWPDEATGE